MQINFELRHFLILIISITIVAGTGLVVGYGGNQPNSMGHTIGEVEGLQANLTDLQNQINMLSGGGGDGIPSGFCIFSPTQTGCPSGWTRAGGFDGKTIRGAATPGGTGGSETHKHRLSSISSTVKDGTGSTRYALSITGYHKYTDTADSWPPYMKVLICCKN